MGTSVGRITQISHWYPRFWIVSLWEVEVGVNRAVSLSSIWFELTVSSHVLLSSPAWPLWSSHSSRVEAHIFLLYSQVTAFGCSLGRCAGFLHTSAYERGRGSCLARGPGSAVVLCWQASVVKGCLPVLYLAKELSQGLGCSEMGFVLPREGCVVLHFWG